MSVLVSQSHCTCMMHWKHASITTTKCLTFFLIPKFIFLHFIFWGKNWVQFTLHQSPIFIFLVLIRCRRFSICICKRLLRISWRHILMWRKLGVTRKHVRAIRYQMKLRHYPLSMHNLLHCSLLAEVFSSLSYLFNKNIMFADL